MKEEIKKRYKKQNVFDKTIVDYSRVVINKDFIKRMAILFVKYKLGYNRDIDVFILTDLYLDVFDNSLDLDCYEELSQVIIMLKKLKEVYDKYDSIKSNSSLSFIKNNNKVCVKCKVNRKSNEFHKNKKTPDGLTYSCKYCLKEYVDSRKLIIKKDLSEKW